MGDPLDSRRGRDPGLLDSTPGFEWHFTSGEPWAPWTTVAYLNDPPFGAGKISASTFVWKFANKWLSEDELVHNGVHRHWIERLVEHSSRKLDAWLDLP